MIRKIKLSIAWQRVIALVLIAAVLVYTVYHITSLFGKDITTIATGLSTESRFVDGKGYIFRNEQLLLSENGGVADYLRSDGDKVSVGEELATVYSVGDSSAKKSIKYYDGKIALLEQSVNANATLADLPEINAQISDSYYALCKMLSSGDTGGISQEADDMLIAMNKYSILTNQNSVVPETLELLSAQRQAILNAGGDSVTEIAPDSGYFYSYADGMEDSFSLSDANSLTLDGFYDIAVGTSYYSGRDLGRVYGKLSESSEWQFVMRVGELAAAYFEEGNAYSLDFAENGNTTIPMTLTRTIDDTKYGGKILFFTTNRLPEGFAFDRCQSVSIQINSFAGIYVPKTAVHRTGGQEYVYVLKGSVVKLRRIDIIYEGSDYYLSSVDEKSGSGTPYLEINEILITRGDNLFDGRILD